MVYKGFRHDWRGFDWALCKLLGNCIINYKFQCNRRTICLCMLPKRYTLYLLLKSSLILTRVHMIAFMDDNPVITTNISILSFPESIESCISQDLIYNFNLASYHCYCSFRQVKDELNDRYSLTLLLWEIPYLQFLTHSHTHLGNIINSL